MGKISEKEWNSQKMCTKNYFFRGVKTYFGSFFV